MIDSRQRKSKTVQRAHQTKQRSTVATRGEKLDAILGTAAEVSSQPCKAKHSRGRSERLVWMK